MNERAGQQAIDLARLRERFGVTQAELASAMGTSQPAVLKLERSVDPQLSSVRRYIEALGQQLGDRGALEIAALIGDDRFVLGFEHEGTHPAGDITRELIAADRPAWRLRAWDDPQLEQRFIDESLIAMSNDEIGDLTDWPGEDIVRHRLAKKLPNRGQQAIGTFVRYWRDFRIAMRRDDTVVVPLVGRRVAVGEIKGDYKYKKDETEPRLRHRRAVKWLAVGLDRDTLDDDLRKVVNAPGTVCRFGAPDAGTRLRQVTADHQSTRRANR